MTDVRGVPLLLLPGLTNDERVWRAVMDGVQPDVQSVTVGDLRGGETMRDVAAHVLAKAPDRFAVAGLSMGGYCALEMFRQAPQRIAGLALVDTSARPDTAEGKANREKQIERARTEYAALVEELLPKWIHPSRLQDPAVADVVRAMARDAGAETFARQQRAIMSRADSRPLLGSIRCPTIVVCGRDDALMPMEIHEELVRGIAGAKLHAVERCGHLAPLERPAAVGDALRTWLQAIG
jgi:pimeloyl-ACP methyl ester carboxylesterase